MDILLQKIILLSRFYKQLILIFFDSFVVVLVILCSFSIRLGYLYWPSGDLFWVIFLAPIIAIPIFLFFQFYKAVIRFIGFKVLWTTTQAVSIYALIWGLIGFMTQVGGIPRSVILINWLLATIVILGSRLFARWLFLGENIDNKNVIIYGAGAAGRQLCNALNESKELNPVAFIDDNTDFHHHSINGIKVFSQHELESLIKKKNIIEVLIAMPSISRTRRNEIVKYLEPYQIIVRSLPGVSELAQGKVKINDLLEINLRDLLGRESIMPNHNLLKTNIHKKVVLVTGAGGSIGSELCRQILFLNPEKIILYEISESSLYVIEQELISIGAFNIQIIPVIGSVADKKRIESTCKYFNIQTIYHAAAYKHVPLVECNQSQGVLNNTIGTLRAAEAAISANVETFVLISTDKAVRPTNIMGASKRAAELILQSLAKQSHNTCFTMVRFGNVLDSSGSVIPLFKKQIKAGGPITVTHIDVVRYFMTIPEAVELVIQAGAMAKGGEAFVLDMGDPIRIYDLAVKMVQLSGLVLCDKANPKGDIKIKFIGLRPGEKLYEELMVDDKFTITENKLIMRAEEDMIPWAKLEPMLAQIKEASTNDSTEEIYKLLKELIPEFNPSPSLQN